MAIDVRRVDAVLLVRLAPPVMSIPWPPARFLKRMQGHCANGRERANVGAAPASGGLYRPRNPRASPLWQCATRHAAELRVAGRLQRAPARVFLLDALLLSELPPEARAPCTASECWAK